VANLKDKRQVDMNKLIVKIFETLLRVLLPAAGRHRQYGASHGPVARPGRAAPAATAAHRVPPRVIAVHAEEPPRVRPYVLTPEERRERWRQGRRRRVLWLASHGIDAGPRWIHGVEVAAR
jgi:hypothetical protein